MKASTGATERYGFLARLRKDQSGNTIAIFAAAIFPMIGLVGGAVDMGRIYAVKTRMQAACDAGSLAARKVMGSGNWSTAASNTGEQFFLGNFESGSLGTKELEPDDVTFTESNGTVTGNATTVVPMALMQILGIKEETISVECTSQMKIPHTDVMFVLDVTGSMGSAIPGDSTVPSKLAGIQRATKCFYEALARQNISDVTPANCYKTADPIGDLSTLTQLRFGFVPYSQQVNIGNILPNGFYKDTQSFQSRRPALETVQTWTVGSPGAISGWSGSFTPTTPPTSPYHTRQSTSGWADVTSGNVPTNQGSKPFRQTGASNSSNCTGSTYNNLSGSSSQLTAISETPGTVGAAVQQGASVPNFSDVPNNQRVLTYNRTRNDTITQYRYVWENRGGGNGCFLERRNHTTLLPRTETGGTAYAEIFWNARQRVLGWTYTQVPFDISAIKAGGGDESSLAYNGTVAMPIAEGTSNVNLSGSATSSNIRVVANSNVAWAGCVEEQTTFQNTDGNSADDYAPIPEEALDMDIDLVPDVSNENTRWGFQLPNAVWTRYSGSTPILNDIYSTSTTALNTRPSAPCLTTQARKLATYNSDAGSISFRNYVNSFAATGSTYHDIGLLWGARLMSPTGIFADENATTEAGAEIQRHMVFMTDGQADSGFTSYTPYGIEPWDLRRTRNGVVPSEADIDVVINARTSAICNRIKTLGNSGVTLWVVYYGPTNDTTLLNRMRSCATSANRHFFLASNTQLLIESFNSIADSISELKLTS